MIAPMLRTTSARSVRSTLSLAVLLWASVAACTSSDPSTSSGPGAEAVASVADVAVAERLAALYDHDRVWPVRVWLEEPLLAEDGAVLVPPRRMGVLVTLHEDGRARVDFGRYGAHSVPVTQTNFVAESERVRRGEATKTHPNLVGMLANRMATTDGDVVSPDRRRLDEAVGGRVLLVFADPEDPAMPSLAERARAIEQAGDVRMRVLVPVTELKDPKVHAALKAAGWDGRFVVTPIARSYVPALLEPGTPTPWLRLASDEGRVIAEGPPDEATEAAMRQALRSESEDG